MYRIDGILLNDWNVIWIPLSNGCCWICLFELIKNEWNELPTNVVFGALNLLNYNFSMFIGCITSWLIENPAKEIWNQVTSPIFAKKNTPRGNSCRVLPLPRSNSKDSIQIIRIYFVLLPFSKLTSTCYELGLGRQVKPLKPVHSKGRSLHFGGYPGELFGRFCIPDGFFHMLKPKVPSGKLT